MEVNTRNILVGGSGIMAIAAILTFLQTDLFHSPITKSLVIIFVGSGVLTATQLQDRPIQIMGSIVFTFASIVAVLYSVIQLTDGTLMIMLAFCVLAIVFLSLAYVLQLEETPSFVTTRNMKIGLLVLGGLTILIVGVDITMATPQQTVTVYDTIQQDSTEQRYGPEYSVGKVVLTNPSFLPQSVESDGRVAYTACVTGLDTSKLAEGEPGSQERIGEELQNVRLVTHNSGTMLVTSEEFELYFPSHITQMMEESDVNPTSVPVVKGADCPSESSSPTVTVLMDK